MEDAQWSPAERDVFSSCGGDGRVCVWDARSHSGAPALSTQAHESDVNVMSWNRRVNYMLATGADDGGVRIWDLRAFGSTASSSVSGVAGVSEKSDPRSWPTSSSTAHP